MILVVWVTVFSELYLIPQAYHLYSMNIVQLMLMLYSVLMIYRCPMYCLHFVRIPLFSIMVIHLNLRCLIQHRDSMIGNFENFEFQE